jgi:hypothetical protein
MAGAVDYEIVFLSHSRNRLGGVVHADAGRLKAAYGARRLELRYWFSARDLLAH